jgi:ribosomal protein S27E
VYFRKCVSGEILTSSLACEACPNNTYYYEAPNSISTCKECGDTAVCYGGNSTAPKAGYWRANATSESYVECPRKASCLGGN